VHRGLKDTGTQRHIDHTGTVQQRQEGHKSHKGTTGSKRTTRATSGTVNALRIVNDAFQHWPNIFSRSTHPKPSITPGFRLIITPFVNEIKAQMDMSR
jgi:hypothetical protein